MKVLNNREFANEVMATANPSRKFEPQIYYDAHTDCVECVLKPDDFYAERIDKLLTVYYSRKTNEMIGSLVKGVGALLKNTPSLGVLVQENGKIKLAHIFVAHIAMERQSLAEPVIAVYNLIIQQAEANKVEFELCSNK